MGESVKEGKRGRRKGRRGWRERGGGGGGGRIKEEEEGGERRKDKIKLSSLKVTVQGFLAVKHF